MTDSEDEIFFGPVTLREMKITFANPPGPKPERRHSTIGFHHKSSLDLDYEKNTSFENMGANSSLEYNSKAKTSNIQPYGDEINTQNVNSDVQSELPQEILTDHVEVSPDHYLSAILEESTKYLSIQSEKDEQAPGKENTIEILDSDVENEPETEKSPEKNDYENDSLQRLLQNESYEEYDINNEIQTLIQTIVISDEEEAEEESFKFNDTLEEMEMFLKEGERLHQLNLEEKKAEISKEQEKSCIEEPQCTEEQPKQEENIVEKKANKTFQEYVAEIKSKSEVVKQKQLPNVKKFFPTPIKQTNLNPSKSASKENRFLTPVRPNNPFLSPKSSDFKVPLKPLQMSNSKKKNSPFKDVKSPVGIYIKSNPNQFVRPFKEGKTIQRWEPIPSAEDPSVSATPSPKLAQKNTLELPTKFYKPPKKQIVVSKEEDQKLPESIRKLVKGTLTAEVEAHVKRVKDLDSSFDDLFMNETADVLLNESSADLFDVTKNSLPMNSDVSLIVSSKAVKY